MKKKQDSSDVTLVLQDDMQLHAHKVILAPASAHGKTVMTIEQKNKDIVEQIMMNHKWTEGTNMELPHYLREDKVQNTLRKHAVDDVEAFTTDYKESGECVIIQCNTG